MSGFWTNVITAPCLAAALTLLAWNGRSFAFWRLVLATAFIAINIVVLTAFWVSVAT